MTREVSFDLLTKTIAEIVNVRQEDITPDTTFVEDLGFTSPGLQALAAVLNERYAVYSEATNLKGSEIAEAANVRNLEVLIWERIEG